jgi:hypothetical protein
VQAEIGRRVLAAFRATRARFPAERAGSQGQSERLSPQESKEARPIASEPHRLPSDRADEVELKLRARAEQFRATEQLKPATTAIGLCHACGRIVYAGDGLAMAGIYLLHVECCPPAGDSAKAP